MPYQFKSGTVVGFEETILTEDNDLAGLEAGDRVIGLRIGDAETGFYLHTAKEYWQDMWDQLEPLLEWKDEPDDTVTRVTRV